MKPVLLMSTIVLATTTPLLAADKSFDFRGFTNVIVRGGVEVEIHSGEAFRVEADVSRRSLLRKLEVRQSGVDCCWLPARQGGRGRRGSARLAVSNLLRRGRTVELKTNARSVQRDGRSVRRTRQKGGIWLYRVPLGSAEFAVLDLVY